MTPSELLIITHAQQANRDAERAYWWMRNIDPDEALHLGVSDMIQQVLAHLQKVDNLTIDIELTIKQKSK